MKLLSFGAAILVGAFSIQASAQVSPPELYRGLTRGMSAAAAAELVLKIDGVKSAKVKRNKAGIDVVDIDHKMRAGGDFGGLRGFVGLEFDSKGLMSVSIVFSEQKNSPPYCLSEGAVVYGRLVEILSMKYQELARSKVPMDGSYVNRARAFIADDHLQVLTGRKPVSHVELVSPSIDFSDGVRVVRLQSNVSSAFWYPPKSGRPDYYTPMLAGLCNADYGIRSRPRLTYLTLEDYQTERRRINSNAEANERAMQDRDRLAAEKF